MEFYGHLAPVLAYLTLILFVLIDATFFGGFGTRDVVGRATLPGVGARGSPFLWVAMELARTYLITGFPWNLLGYAVHAEGMRQIASVTGVYGLSFLAVGHQRPAGVGIRLAAVPASGSGAGHSRYFG